MLGLDRSPPQLLQCLHALARRNEALLVEGRSLNSGVVDTRLGLEIAVIQAYADKIVQLLKVRDPLNERVHLRPHQFLGYSVSSMAMELMRRVLRRPAAKRAAGA
jgi:hypothetical protein